MLHGLGTGPWTRWLLMDCSSCTHGESGSSRACRGGRTGYGSSRGLIRVSNSQLRTGIFFANEQNVSWTRVHVSTEKIPTIWGGYWCSSSNEEEEFCASESSIYSRCIILCASHSYSFVRATNQSYDLNSLHWLYHVLGACYLLCSLWAESLTSCVEKVLSLELAFKLISFGLTYTLRNGWEDFRPLVWSNPMSYYMEWEQVEPS